MRRKETELRGSMTVEMSFIMPLILLLLMSSIFAVFYFHDKNILAGAAYETAVVGSTKMREREKAAEDELETLCRERLRGKCILFAKCSVEILIEEEEITVEIRASKGRLQTSVQKKAAVTEPEDKIRDIRRIKEIGNGANNHN